MPEYNKYTVIELSEKIGVPRTTITDWLNRYSQYIDFKIQGKRKIYTDKSIEVLFEIKNLRDSGLSSFDIEEELAKRHPIHGEISQENAANKAPENNNPQPTNTQLANINTEGQQIAEMLKNMLLEMTRRMDELERQNRLNMEKTRRWNVFAMSLILVLAGVSLAAFFLIKTVTEEKESIDKEKLKYLYLSEQLSSELKKNQNEKNELTQKVLEIDGNRNMLANELENLKKEIEKQQKEFELILKNSIKDAEFAKEAEILKIRDEFAAEKLKFLQELEKLNKEIQKNQPDTNTEKDTPQQENQPQIEQPTERITEPEKSQGVQLETEKVK